MYTRLLPIPKKSILLLGPRGTGKSTWIRQNFANAVSYDLLDHRESLRLQKEPYLLFDELQHLPKSSWVVIDEIQKVPALLDEVQRLMETRKINFVLSGSSARKLKKGTANLLAGRAITTQLFPLVSAEVGFKIQFPDFFTNGMLPMAFTTDEPLEYLQSYVEIYLKEEVQAEALTRNIGSFARFLEIAARQNSQMTNTSAISRDAMVERKTVENYFQILVDTLIGNWLPAWKLKKSNKQVLHSKFYFFDSGVARALSGRMAYPPTQEELGPLLETSLLNELRAYIAYNKLHYEIFFWRTYDAVEVDLILETKNGYVAIECKCSPRWEKKFNRGLQRVQEDLGVHKVKCFGVYQGSREMHIDNIHILPVMNFLKQLWDGKIV